MSDPQQVYESVKLFPLFANRLLSPSRSEYVSYLRWCGFAPGQLPDDLAILGITQGRRQTDSVEVFPSAAIALFAAHLLADRFSPVQRRGIPADPRQDYAPLHVLRIVRAETDLVGFAFFGGHSTRIITMWGVLMVKPDSQS